MTEELYPLPNGEGDQNPGRWHFVGKIECSQDYQYFRSEKITPLYPTRLSSEDKSILQIKASFFIVPTFITFRTAYIDGCWYHKLWSPEMGGVFIDENTKASLKIEPGHLYYGWIESTSQFNFVPYVLDDQGHLADRNLYWRVVNYSDKNDCIKVLPSSTYKAQIQTLLSLARDCEINVNKNNLNRIYDSESAAVVNTRERDPVYKSPRNQTLEAERCISICSKIVAKKSNNWWIENRNKLGIVQQQKKSWLQQDRSSAEAWYHHLSKPIKYARKRGSIQQMQTGGFELSLIPSPIKSPANLSETYNKNQDLPQSQTKSSLRPQLSGKDCANFGYSESERQKPSVEMLDRHISKPIKYVKNLEKCSTKQIQYEDFEVCSAPSSTSIQCPYNLLDADNSHVSDLDFPESSPFSYATPNSISQQSVENLGIVTQNGLTHPTHYVLDDFCEGSTLPGCPQNTSKPLGSLVFKSTDLSKASLPRKTTNKTIRSDVSGESRVRTRDYIQNYLNASRTSTVRNLTNKTIYSNDDHDISPYGANCCPESTDHIVEAKSQLGFSDIITISSVFLPNGEKRNSVTVSQRSCLEDSPAYHQGCE